MTLRFYFVPFSTASITEAVLAELGVECDRVQLDIQAGDTRQPAFLAINPNGRVPAITHDGTAIWESAAITMYLGETFGVRDGLYPAPGPKRGEAMAWIVWSNVSLAEAAGRFAAALPPGSPGAVEPGSRDWVPPAERSPRAAETAARDLTQCLAILDGRLAVQPFLVGAYTLADTHVQGFVGWIGSMAVDLSPFSHVVGWMERCSARPALAQLRAD
jgi:glutathione S-transferase